MKNYLRPEPLFALCGLNCCLCPRFHTDGASKCPGCGGQDFANKHPTCSVMTCNNKHDRVEYCFLCSAYPCQKYAQPSAIDSFVSYREVINNFNAASQDLSAYLQQLKLRHSYLIDLIQHYNDGRSKGFYCIALNNLPFVEIENVMRQIRADGDLLNLSEKERAAFVVELFTIRAASLGIDLVLKK